MPIIPDGGTPTTKQVTISDSPAVPTLLAPQRNGNGNGYRSGLVIVNIGANIVYVGGPSVTPGSISSGTGIPLYALPSPQTTPLTPPQALSLSTTNAAVYGITEASAGGGTVVVYEEVIAGG